MLTPPNPVFSPLRGSFEGVCERCSQNAPSSSFDQAARYAKVSAQSWWGREVDEKMVKVHFGCLVGSLVGNGEKFPLDTCCQKGAQFLPGSALTKAVAYHALQKMGEKLSVEHVQEWERFLVLTDGVASQNREQVRQVVSQINKDFVPFDLPGDLLIRAAKTQDVPWFLEVVEQLQRMINPASLYRVISVLVKEKKHDLLEALFSRQTICSFVCRNPFANGLLDHVIADGNETIFHLLAPRITRWREPPQLLRAALLATILDDETRIGWLKVHFGEALVKKLIEVSIAFGHFHRIQMDWPEMGSITESERKWWRDLATSEGHDERFTDQAFPHMTTLVESLHQSFPKEADLVHQQFEKHLKKLQSGEGYRRILTLLRAEEEPEPVPQNHPTRWKLVAAVVVGVAAVVCGITLISSDEGAS